ncbi:unnamed protein product, partial [Tetraodon nigroviridis]
MVYVVCVPLILAASWEHISINLAELTYELFGTEYVETVKVKIHANCRIRRVYFTNRIYADKDLPKAFKVNVSEESKKVKTSKTAKTDDKAPPPELAGSGDQDRITELNKQMGTPLPTSVAGHDYIRGIQSILNSIDKDPLRFWRKKVESGHVESVMDEDIRSSAIEVQGRNMQNNFITCPVDPEGSLGIRLPILNMLLKKTGEDFSFEITVIDNTNVRRQIVQTTFKKDMKAKVCVVCFPIRLSDSWERIDFNLAELTNELFGTEYVETAKIQIHANCRIRRVYFSDRLYSNEELPKDFKVNISEENEP